jgi:uncharacterized RDD family membrane protein YckC
MKDTISLENWTVAADSRSAATVIDCIFAFPCMLLVSPAFDLAASSGMPWWAVWIVTLMIWALVTTAIFAALESSALRATPGKLICGLAVISEDGSRLRFLKGLKRNSIKYTMGLYGLIPLFKSNWAPNGAMHDAASGSAVVIRKEIV